MTQVPITECRFCSLVSQANGEDPIGSAPVTDACLIVELPQPWSAQLLQSTPEIQPVLALIKTLALDGIRVRPIAIAPDRSYSRPGYTRLLFYARPSGKFTVYNQQEYLLPRSDVAPLAIALLQQLVGQPHILKRFQRYRQENGPTRDLLVCTHSNVDAACARFGFPIYDKLRKHYADRNLRVWRCSHFGGHQYAPTLLDLPEGRYWGHLEPDLLDALVYRTGDLVRLTRCYRGWAGLGKFEQIAEREVWRQEGWDWLTYQQQGMVLRLGENWLRRWLRRVLYYLPSKRLRLLLERSKQDAAWAEVQIDYATPSGQTGGYRARVAISGQVLTAIRSAEPLELVPVNQYQVSDLVKLG
ncbi:sucrase ferredoxin [Leptolyngbya sp. NK1-12]|uniref:Sucrase ferredoxin n=1 Tax=Leptolyngbya sp. NK1-12 TaxID=2547451 RepID=A0AA96WJJ3_9CYAN|nr:sucrase ferredoxin [Leptolyngbya sp. NK1-12]